MQTRDRKLGRTVTLSIRDPDPDPDRDHAWGKVSFTVGIGGISTCCHGTAAQQIIGARQWVKWIHIHYGCILTFHCHFLSSISHPQAWGPWSQSGCVGFSGERHRHPCHVPVLPYLLPARTIQPRQGQEGGTEQVGRMKDAGIKPSIWPLWLNLLHFHTVCCCQTCSLVFEQTRKLVMFSPSQVQGQALIASQWVLAGERRGRMGSLPSSKDLPPLTEDEPPSGPWQPPLSHRRPHWIWEQRIPEVIDQHSKGAMPHFHLVHVFFNENNKDARNHYYYN